MLHELMSTNEVLSYFWQKFYFQELKVLRSQISQMKNGNCSKLFSHAKQIYRNEDRFLDKWFLNL